jgi:hypothetical protein
MAKPINLHQFLKMRDHVIAASWTENNRSSSAVPSMRALMAPEAVEPGRFMRAPVAPAEPIA